jgi:hypothetical protein
VEQAERLELAFQAPGAEALTVTATRAEAGWSSTPEAIEPAKLATLIDELSRLRAQKILADAMGEPELRELGLAPPNVRLTVSGEKGELARVEIGVAKGSEGVVARSGGGPTVYLLAGSAADFLPLSVEALRSRFRVEAPAAEAAEAPAAAPDAPEAASP